MGLIYGNKTPLTEEAILEQEFLNEMMFTRDDLQNPKTLDKIVKSKERFASTIEFLSNLFCILGLIGSLALGVFCGFLSGVAGFTLLMFIIVKTTDIVSEAPVKQFNKNSEKFKSQVNRFKKRAEEALENDPKNKSKYQKMISNCEKVLKEIDKREKEARELLEKQQFNRVMSAYNSFVDWCECPFVVGHTGDDEGWSLSFFTIPKQLGIPESTLVRIIKENGIYSDNWDLFYMEDDFSKHCKVKKMFEGDQYVHLSSDDDYNVFYSKRHNKIFYTDADTEFKETTLYSEAGNEKIFETDELLEADRESGYYIAARCPEQVKRKPFPVEL